MVSEGKKSSICLGIGSILVVLGAVAVVFWPVVFYNQLQSRMILTNTSASYDLWKETPIPMYLECFMFNITNVDDILAGRADKVEVEQLGPYVFRETHIKANQTWNENGTVTFYNQRWWHFMPDMTNGSLSDEIVSVNPVVVTVAFYMRHRSTIANLPIDVFLRLYHRNMFLSANVSSWLFDGIDDPILDAAEMLPDLIDIPYDKFGWFYERNGSMEYDGAFLMNTGAYDFSQLGNVEKWKHSNRTLYREHCGEVRGSTGDLWAPELGQEEVTIFASDVCTYLTLHKEGDYTTLGISGVMYAANDSIFDNGYKYPRMECYCAEVRDRECMPPGALNVSACRLGAPAFVTLPHFTKADPSYASKIRGLDNETDYSFRMALELYTGIPLFAAAQLQINLLVRAVPGISINNVLPDADTLVPMFWFRQQVALTPEYAALARQALNVRFIVPYVMYGVTGIGLVLLISGIIVLIKKLLRSPDTEPILNEGPSTSE